jgi:hypothetical protein
MSNVSSVTAQTGEDEHASQTRTKQEVVPGTLPLPKLTCCATSSTAQLPSDVVSAASKGPPGLAATCTDSMGSPDGTPMTSPVFTMIEWKARLWAELTFIAMAPAPVNAASVGGSFQTADHVADSQPGAMESSQAVSVTVRTAAVAGLVGNHSTTEPTLEADPPTPVPMMLLGWSESPSGSAKIERTSSWALAEVTDTHVTAELKRHLRAFLEKWNREPTPFVWTNSAHALVRDHRKMLDRISRTTH